MKNLILIGLLSLPFLSHSQSMGSHAHVTSNKDTLYLLQNDSLSNVTYSIWKNDTIWKGDCPTIIFIDPKQMSFLKRETASIEFVRMTRTTIKPKRK